MTSRKILAVVSNYGYWGVELSGPMAKLDDAGYELVIATPAGARPVALPPSYDIAFVDPPLGKRVTTESDARQVMTLEASPRLDHPIDLSAWFPERPYFSASNFLREWEHYFELLRERDADLVEYDGLLLVGGSGPILDMVNNQRVHDLVLGFYRADKPIAAICYGVACSRATSTSACPFSAAST